MNRGGLKDGDQEERRRKISGRNKVRNVKMVMLIIPMGRIFLALYLLLNLFTVKQTEVFVVVGSK